MPFKFDIKYIGWYSIGEIEFTIDYKTNHWIFQVHTPDSDDWNNIYSYYFVFETINEYGAKLKYVEYVDCFEKIAFGIGHKKYLKLFNLDINKEFENIDKNELKDFFLEINEYIIKKVKNHFKNYFEIEDNEDSEDDESI